MSVSLIIDYVDSLRVSEISLSTQQFVVPLSSTAAHSSKVGQLDCLLPSLGIIISIHSFDDSFVTLVRLRCSGHKLVMPMHMTTINSGPK